MPKKSNAKTKSALSTKSAVKMNRLSYRQKRKIPAA